MQKGEVFLNDLFVGIIEKDNGDYTFQYSDEYFHNPATKAISFTLPKTQQEYHSETLFAFFFGLLPEGINKEMICKELKIDEDDLFTLLLKVADTDTIGAVTIKEVKDV